MTLPLSSILTHLNLRPQEPGIPFLHELLVAWSARIPWESASRIARHQRPGSPHDHARGPDAFFRDALALGTGGTCFESNGALRALLTALGFDCATVFCDMDDGSTPDPHCALLVPLDGGLYLADVGYPVPAALRLNERDPTAVETPAYRFEATPFSGGRWEVRRRSGDYVSQAFVIKAEPVGAATFQARLLRDHQPDGLFLDEVIIHKTLDGHMLRFSEGKGLIRRAVGVEEPVPLSEAEQADLPGTLVRRFGMNEAVIRAALSRTPPDGVPGWAGGQASGSQSFF